MFMIHEKGFGLTIVCRWRRRFGSVGVMFLVQGRKKVLRVELRRLCGLEVVVVVVVVVGGGCGSFSLLKGRIWTLLSIGFVVIAFWWIVVVAFW
jgi:hypothetical protein